MAQWSTLETERIASLRTRAQQFGGDGVSLGHLRPGTTRGEMLARRRLGSKLSTTTPGLTRVTAPAGSGKTTLACQWMAGWPNDHIGWLSLGPSHNSVPGLLRSLRAATCVALDRHLDPEPELPASDAAADTVAHTYVRGLAKALSITGEPTAIVFDDVHVLTSPVVLDLLASYLTVVRGSDVRVIMLSRADVPVPAYARRIDVGHHELLFSPDEVAAVLAERASGLARDELTREIAEATGGWPALVGLAAHVVASRGGEPGALLTHRSRLDRWMADFVVEELLDTQPAPIRRFMLQCSVVDELCSSLCDAVGDDFGEAHVVIDELDRQGLLVPLDDEGLWWRFHHLVLELLRRRAVIELGDLRPLHAAAAQWLAADGQYSLAVDHAAAAGRYDIVLANVQAAFDAYQNYRLGADRVRWFDAIPDDVLLDNPAMLRRLGFFIRFNGTDEQQRRVQQLTDRADLEEAESWNIMLGLDVPAVERAVAAADAEAHPAGELARSVPVLASLLAYVHGDPRAALESAERGAAENEGDVAAASSWCMAAVMHHHLGAFDEADAILAEWDRVTVSPIVNAVVSWAATLAAARHGDRTELDRRSELVTAVAPGPTMWVWFAFQIDRALALHAVGDSADAAELLHEVRRGLDECADPGVLVEHCEKVAAAVGVRLELDPIRHRGRTAGLTDRELDVLGHLDLDTTTAAVADTLGVSPNTVKSYVRSIYTKLGLHDRASLTALKARWESE